MMNKLRDCGTCKYTFGQSLICVGCSDFDKWDPDKHIDLIEPTGDMHGLIEAKPPTKTETKQPDAVNHPSHYTFGAIECIDAIKAMLTAEEFRGYCKGNAIKYIWRERHKGSDESIEKAAWYIKAMGGAK